MTNLPIARSAAFPALCVAAALLAGSVTALAQGLPEPVDPAEIEAPAPAAEPAAPQEFLAEDIVAWVNDDIVMLSDLIEREQAFIARMIRQQGMRPEEIEGRLTELRQSILLQLVWDHLLVQEAEKHFSIENIRRELVERFMESNEIESLSELDEVLRQEFGMTRSELGDRLLLRSAPDYVVQMIVMPRLGVTEEAAREYYEANLDQFTTPASVTFRELVLLDSTAADREKRRPEAEALAARARAGEDFVALIEESSEAASRAIEGKIGPLSPGDLIPEIAEAVTEATVGGIEGPVETSQGLHILLVEERTDASVRPFEEVRNASETALRAKMLETEYQEFVEGLWRDSIVEVRELYADMLPEAWREMTVVRN